ncbi:MAG: SRPBCC family protein, partial [Terriglobales bacterium]
MNNSIRQILLIITLALAPVAGRAQPDTPLVHEGVVNAPLAQVWAAFTTKEGLESWMAAHAEIDLRVGGVMKTEHDAKGSVDGASSIANTILSYEPMRMLSLRVTKFPEGFPFPNAIRQMWTMVYFE